MRRFKLPPYQRSKKRTSPLTSPASTFSFSYSLVQSTGMTSLPLDQLPNGCFILENQVAGHTFQVGTDEVGMLKNPDDGSVLKPGGTKTCETREINFYEQMQNSTDATVLQLKEFIPEYRGTKELVVGNRKLKFIKLIDLTFDMLEPCIIDIKMGRRTWDPLATDKKREAEDSKYVDCKTTVGFCIPGLQTFSLNSNDLKKFGKDYGKKLNEKTVKDALRLYLNADYSLNRQLILQILSKLWPIQKFMRTQTTFQFYSSSILIVYDARRLRQLVETQKRSGSFSDKNKSWPTSPTTPDDKKYNKTQYNGFGRGSGNTSPNSTSTTHHYKKLQRCHSNDNNYEKDMKQILDNYNLMLDNLIGIYDSSKDWIHVKMIDFAHTFRNDELPEKLQQSVDKNYLEAIENLVRIFEEFLKECE